jgi:hypothetical protein
MEQIARVTPYPQTKSHIPALRLLSCLLLVLVLTCGFTLIILSIRMLPPIGASPDPFAAVTDIFTAQSTNDLHARGFSCSSNDHNYADSAEGWCTFSPPTGIFLTIEVKFINNDLYSRFFLVRDDALAVGDLVKLWGRPRIQQQGIWGKLDWPGSGVMGWTGIYQGRYSLFLPVRSILFLSADE